MLKRLAVLFLSILVATAAFAQTKKRIEREADIPRFTYKVDGKLEDIVGDRIAKILSVSRAGTGRQKRFAILDRGRCPRACRRPCR